MAFKRLFLALTLLSGGLARADVPPVPYPMPLDPVVFTPQTCGEVEPTQPVTEPFPLLVTGRTSFYAAEYDAAGRRVMHSVSYGPVTDVQPTASIFKSLIVDQVLQDVDSGRLSLNTKFKTTPENRTIEFYPAGTNTLGRLARRAIELSDNTAADILFLALGTERFGRSVLQKSPCTHILLTGKAAWAAQAGLLVNTLGPDVLAAALNYAGLPDEERLKVAQRLNAEAQRFTAPQLEKVLDAYFTGPDYSHVVDLAFQHTTTAKAYTDLVAQTYGGQHLQPGTAKFYRDLLSKGCCQPKKPKLKYTYWGAKAGTGWRFVTMTGYVETPEGRTFAYTYMNDMSEATDALSMEKQIRPVLGWIEQALLQLQAMG